MHDRDLIPYVVLRDDSSGSWLKFSHLTQIIQTRKQEEVFPKLQALSEAVEKESSYAVGFLAYEAGNSFHFPKKETFCNQDEFPLLWFGLFSHFTRHDELPPSHESPSLYQDWYASVNQQEYRNNIEKIHKYIARGETYQVNYSYRLNTTNIDDPWNLFLYLIENQESRYGAYLDTGEWVLCSASPELFFRLDGKHIESHPMKGTSPRGLWYENDRQLADRLRHSTKEQAENVMITDMVRNDLGRISEMGHVCVPQLFSVEKYPTVWQMVSMVRAQTIEPLPRIFEAMFPAASITGAPKRRTMEIISELETRPRRIYTGTIGYLAPDRKAQFNVAIRTVFINKRTGEAEYGVGGGIVWDSQWGREEKECQIKSRILHHRKPSFDLLETIRWTKESGFFLLSYHLKRLSQSASYFNYEVDLTHVKRELEQTVAELPGLCYKVRLLLSRNGSIKIETTPLDLNASFIPKVIMAKESVDKNDPFLYHKTTHRNVYQKAFQSRPGYSDVILYNSKNEITETTTANLLVENDGILYTPPIDCGLLPGTYREYLLDTGKIQERILYLKDLFESSSIYRINSVRGMQKVRLVYEES